MNTQAKFMKNNRWQGQYIRLLSKMQPERFRLYLCWLCIYCGLHGVTCRPFSFCDKKVTGICM